MNIKDIAVNFLYDQNEYIIWSNGVLYIYGVKELVIINEKRIKLNLINNTVDIKGHNLKITRSGEKELSIQGEIHEITK